MLFIDLKSILTFFAIRRFGKPSTDFDQSLQVRKKSSKGETHGKSVEGSFIKKGSAGAGITPTVANLNSSNRKIQRSGDRSGGERMGNQERSQGATSSGKYHVQKLIS